MFEGRRFGDCCYSAHARSLPCPRFDESPTPAPSEEAEDWGNITAGEHVDYCRDLNCLGCVASTEGGER